MTNTTNAAAYKPTMEPIVTYQPGEPIPLVRAASSAATCPHCLSPIQGELAQALSRAQGEMRGAAKTSSNPFFKSKYADLSEVWEVARKPLSDNGLAVVQSPGFADGRVTVSTAILKGSERLECGVVSLLPVKDDPQAVGSAITYGRRYGLCAALGICPEDDDGNEATHPTPAARPATRPAERMKPDPELPASTAPPVHSADVTVEWADLVNKVLKVTTKEAGEFVFDRTEDFDGMRAMIGKVIHITYKERTVGGRTYRYIQQFWIENPRKVKPETPSEPLKLMEVK